MSYGYVDDAARLVHSVPVEVESAALGRVVVRWRAPRNPRAEAGRDVPTLSRLGVTVPADGTVTPPPGEPHGIELHHLTFRPDNRARVSAYLAMACQSIAGMAAEAARREAEAILDAILDANQAYYRRLDELVVTSADPFLPLAEVSLIQQQRLSTLWG
ncbi:MAG: hypothetical protein QG597_969 [Actinomycetota bacterium]|nr:hypothetical protein [Actinomycetota bacterium]